MEPADLESLRRLVRCTRLLVAAEREGGVVDLPGTPAPEGEEPAPAIGDAAPAGDARAAARAAAAAVGAPRAAERTAAPPVDAAPERAAPASGSPVRRPPAPSFHPRVRELDLPETALAPFGSLVDEVAECRKCALGGLRTFPVFGEGSAPTPLVFCGEAPGFEEDRTGRPFVGRAGELLTAMIEKGLKLRREDVFILNALKCRPPDNRTPTPDEIAACRPHLERQLAVLRPKVIVALGNPAVRALLGDVGGIMKIRGKEFHAFGATVVPTFHPAYLLRNPEAKRDAWEDLKHVLRLLETGPAAPPPAA